MSIIRWGIGFGLGLAVLVAGTTGKITGTVTDQSTGEPLVGVNVMVDGSAFGAATDARGVFTILQVPPGQVNIQASMIGYRTVRLTGIRIQIDLTTRVNIQMEREAIGMGDITVTADRPLIQPDVTYSQENISTEEIEALPVEEFEDLVSLQAGVVMGAGGGIHIRGGRSSEISYLVDGIQVSDPYSAGIGVEIENNAIQELQIISGTFNAEYGQAMSGIINIVTKEGDYNHFGGRFQGNFGDYFTSDTRLYSREINTIDWLSLQDFQGSVEGPLWPGKASYFLSGRYKTDDGFYYGTRRYYPDSYSWSDSLKSFKFVKPGDDKVIPMSWSKQLSWQGKVNVKPFSRTKLSFNVMGSRTEYQVYSHKFKYNPDGRYHYYRQNQTVYLKLDQSLSPTSYILASMSLGNNANQNYVYKNPVDDRYNVDPSVFSEASGYNFYIGGYQMGHYNRSSRVWTAKLEYLNQITDLHQLRAGFESRKTTIDYKRFSVLYNQNTGYQPEIPEDHTVNYDAYSRTPKEWSAYAQDKVEYGDLVLNLGVRYDVFDPRWKTLSDPADPNYRNPLKPINQYVDLNGDGTITPEEMIPDNRKTDADRLQYWYRTTPAKSQVSPRLAVAYPITDRGVLHFSYGHFFQIPPFTYLYLNPDFEVTPSLSTTMGNADLEPERTTQYEIGFQQQIGLNVGVDVTGFYKDIRNLLGTKIVDTFIAGDRYALYINRDYGNVRGVTASLTMRRIGNVSGALDYTYSVAEGNASDPATAYYDELNGNEPEKQLVPLDWDQRHTLNGTVTFYLGKSGGISLVGQYGSGLPYTPSLAGTRLSFENSERKPATVNVDLRSHWTLALFGLNFRLQMNIYNLFDTRNERLVYSDTGRATYSLVSTYLPEDQKYNTLTEYLTRPDYFSAPRQVKIGISVAL
ncbi:MAG: TonB-dependent receptor [FCB group bacterium]|nr:TonB-dependent receptor [FCB group bacterium]